MQVLLSAREIDKLTVLKRVEARRLTQREAAGILGMSERHVRRLLRTFRATGAAGLASKRRGRPSNRRINEYTQEDALDLIRERYADYGPTLAQEKLSEHHAITVSRDTLRRWMVADGLWVPRARRQRLHQPRARRACFGELVQADGSLHDWFEGRGPKCTLLVFVDDATGALMELRFAPAETTWSYFEATRNYVERWGRPVAFYTDKHSVFRINAPEQDGHTQFARALSELHIDLICANSPQAKGRVERANRTLQDRLVKEMRDLGISDIDSGNEMLEEFRVAYNKRFACDPQSAHDAHRRLRYADKLDEIFSIQSERKLSKELTFQYKNQLYVLIQKKSVMGLRGQRIDIFEAADGTLTVKHGRRTLAYREPSQQPERRPGRVVSSKELDSEMAVMKAKQPPVAPKRHDRLAHLIDASLSRDATRNAETRTSLLRGESGHL
jgi:transposase